MLHRYPERLRDRPDDARDRWAAVEKYIWPLGLRPSRRRRQLVLDPRDSEGPSLEVDAEIELGIGRVLQPMADGLVVRQ
jgi:hypothetical protein